MISNRWRSAGRTSLEGGARGRDALHARARVLRKKVTYNPPTYCADVAGTLFDKDNWGWNASKLDSLLSRTLRKGVTLDGVNSSYLYFGMWRSLFAWHTEDMDLYSVNYLHYGAPKFWYAVAPEDRERFEILAQVARDGVRVPRVPPATRNSPHLPHAARSRTASRSRA